LARDKDAILQELLVLRCRRGERRALDELIAGWQGRLFYYIRRLVGSEEDAWDVLQQTWMKVFKGIKTLNAAEESGCIRLPDARRKAIGAATIAGNRGSTRPATWRKWRRTGSPIRSTTLSRCISA
jgi:hypothetical protein